MTAGLRISQAARLATGFPAPGGWQPRLRPGIARLSAGYPFTAAIPVEELRAAAEAVLREEGPWPLQYLGSAAMASLGPILARRAAARGVMTLEEPAERQCLLANAVDYAAERSAPDALLVTAGSAQALDLAARALLDPGDRVAVEAPTYMEALEILRNYGEVEAHPVDGEGLDVDAFADSLRRRRRAGEPLPRLLYVIPNFQNPSGAVLSPARRARLLELAEEFDFAILEDDAYGELAFPDVEAPPSLRRLAPAGRARVVHLGSLSKVVAPGLRVGYAVGPRRIIEAMATFKKDLDQPLSQAVAGRYLRDVDLDARVAWLRRAYAERARVLLAALREEMPAGVSWSTPRGGFFIWLELPGGLDAAALLPRAIDAGVSYVPGEHFHWGAGGANRLRLSYSFAEPDDLRRGAAILARVIRGA